MNIDQARGLLNEIEALLYSGSGWDMFWRNVLNEIRAGDVDGLFHEALAKINALGALDDDLNKFISALIRSQIHQFYEKLYKTRRWHLINGHVYKYTDVLRFIKDSQTLIRLLRNKVEQIHTEACKVTEEWFEHSEANSTVQTSHTSVELDKTKAQIFVGVQKVLCEQLDIDETQVSLTSHLIKDLGLDNFLDFIELALGLEEEFDIEIPDNELEGELGIYCSNTNTGYRSYSGGSFWGGLASLSSLSSSSFSSSVSAGPNCIISSVVDYIHKKLYN